MATTQDEMIAELRRANVELRQEHDLALAREAALADVLDIVGRSPGDPAPVFDAILEKAHSLCDAAMGALVLYDGEFFRAVASHGFPEQHATLICQPYRPNRHHLPLLRGERFIHVPDIRAVGTSDHEVFRNLVQKTDARTLLIVPLRKDGTLLGNITAYRLKVRPYSDKEITLLENFATQAVIAIENARLLGELRQRTADLEESLEYQTATSDVLKVISRSTFDLHPVLSMVAETAARLCAADQAALIRHENGIIEMVANSGFPPEYEARLKKLGPHPLVADAPMVAYRAINERRVVHIHDVAAVPGYAVEPIELGLQRTSLGVPLLRAGEPIGSILLARQRVEPFTDRQIELVSTFADQAVIAIENTRLLTEQREALEQQTATAEVLQVINASPGDLTPVFDAIVEKAHSLCDAAYGSLQLWDGEKFYGVVMRGFAAPMVERLRQGYSPYPNMPCRRLVEGERVAHCADLAEIDDPTARSGVELGGVRTILYVALRKDDALLGQIVAARQEVRPFSKKEISLVESFAAQAVIAMENARLINEQREALEQQTATAEVLQVINASPGDLVPVFDAMLEKAMRLCGGTIGGIFTFDGDHSVTSAIRGVTAAFAQYNDKYPMDEIRPGTVPARIIETRGPVQYADMTAGEPYRAGHPYARALVELGGIRATLAVPFLKDGVAVGMVAIYRQEVGAFSDKQIVLLQNFAGQAVIAMENARLLTEQQEALEQQTATAEVLQVINASPGNLPRVFDALLEKALRLCGASFGTLATYDGERIERVAFLGVPPAFIEYNQRNPLTKNAGLIAQGIATGKPVQATDIMTDARLASSPSVRDALVKLGGVRALLQVPMLKDGGVVGFIGVWRREPGVFPEKQIALLEGFAAQAVIAMENARLITEQREALEQQTAMTEVLGIINASPGNLDPVFEAILERAMYLCEAAFGGFWMFVRDRYVATALHGVPDAYAEFVARNTQLPGPGSAPYRFVNGERSVLQNIDLADDELYRTGNAQRRALVEIGGARTALHVPLRTETALGVITLYRQEVRAFSDKQIALLQNFAAQAVIAMENARLLTEQQEALEQQTATAEVLQVINASPGNLAPVFNAMLEKAMRLCEAAHGHIWIYDGERAHSVAVRGLSDLVEWMRQVGSLRPGASPLGRIVRGESIVHIADALEDKAYSINSAFRDQVNAGRLRTILAIALRKENTLLGVIVVHRQEVRPFSDKHIALLQNFAAQAVIAMENARLIDGIRAARDNAEAAFRELKAAQANLIQAEKMASLGQLTAGIAHEIKNPLNFVNNFAALSVDLLTELKETAAPGFAALTDDQRTEIDDVSAMLTSNLEKITEHGKRADGIVKAMLEHSRGSSVERRMVDLNAVIDEALNLAYHGARAQDQSFNITLERDFGEGIAPIEVNPQDMTRVFLNLFSNGFYATTRQPSNGADAVFVPMLKVTTRDAGDTVEIRVRDNGTGIPPEIRDKLFQPFFTTKPTGEGTGLGLSITYDIVTKQHGGTINVDSEVDAFTEFVVTLPRQMFATEGDRP